MKEDGELIMELKPSPQHHRHLGSIQMTVKDILKSSVPQRLRAMILPRIEIQQNILPGITIDLCPIRTEVNNLIKQ